MPDNNHIIDRLLYPSDQEIRLDANGLIVVTENMRKYMNLLNLDEFAQLPGSILIAEGGMGKTTLMRQLVNCFPDGCALLLELGLFNGDPNSLRSEIDKFTNSFECNSTLKKSAIIFDGLDEASELVGTIIRKMRELPDDVTVWISSRDISAIRAIQSEFPQMKTYLLAPLSETNILEFAKISGVNSNDFLQAINRAGITPICAKPLGCKLALLVFQDSALEGLRQVDLWHKGIERLCDENPSITRRIQPLKSFTINEIVDCAAWIGICLTLTNNTAIWVDEESYCPEKCATISNIMTDEFSPELIRETLERGVFTPCGDGRIRFSHSIYHDYLSAYGFYKYIPTEAWNYLLMSNDRKGVLQQRDGVATWLLAYNKGFLEEIFEIQPELLLNSNDAIQSVGPETLCNALLDRTDSISYEQRRSFLIRNNLFRLTSKGISYIIRERILNPNTTISEIEFATEIAEQCSCKDIADIFADRALDPNIPLQQRIDASYAVYIIDNEEEKARLKELIPIKPSDDPEDELRGNVLRCCWPNHLSPSELIDNIIWPQKENLTGSYGVFLEYDLPKTFSEVIDENKAPDLLEWAINYITADDPFDRIGRLSRTIYSYCWQWTSKPNISMLLANGYIAAAKKYKSPFLKDKYSNGTKSVLILSRDDFIKDNEGRLAVLEALLQSVTDDNVITHIPYNDYPLYIPEDFTYIIKKALEEPHGTLFGKWITCIKSILRHIDVEIHKEDISKLHNLRPDLLDSIQKIKQDIELAAKRSRELNEKWNNERETQELQWKEDQNRIDEWIKTTLQQTEIVPENFDVITAWLFSENGRRDIGSIDITQSPGWGKLSPEERDALVILAERYLIDGMIKKTEPGYHIYSVAQALLIILKMKPGLYNSLSEDVWEKISVELLKSAYQDNIEELKPLFDTLSESFPDIADEALINVVCQELESGHISILRYWGERLSDNQAESLLQIAKDLTLGAERSYTILKELVNCGKENLVRNYLDKLMNDKWDPHPEVELNNHVFLFLKLSPISYAPLIIKGMQTNREWGRQWIEHIPIDYGNGLYNAISRCEPDVISELYIWLHNEYPLSTRPEHEGEYSLGPLDNIHMLKSNLIIHISRSSIIGSVAALERIKSQFPDNEWLHHCIIDAKRNEQAAMAPTLSFSDIKSLRHKYIGSRCVINSINDLHDIVSNKLDMYQIELQGDNPAIGDIWNTEKPIKPRDEEYFSDHLSRSLRKSLISGIVINREVQIRRKLYKDGVAGSRTDIWIQAVDENKDILTLCIEVKCNWNSSSKTALKDQLIDKYMSGGTAKAGILILGWYACNDWDRDDNRMKESTRNWKDINDAKSDLEKQSEYQRNAGNFVSTKVIDCSLK